jgi:hypothetical protein
VNYNVIVSPNAFEGLKHVEPDALLKLIPCIHRSLQALGANPVGLGQKPIVPYPEQGQIYPFECHANGVSYKLVAIFCYGESETEIHILSVRFRRTIM